MSGKITLAIVENVNEICENVKNGHHSKDSVPFNRSYNSDEKCRLAKLRSGIRTIHQSSVKCKRVKTNYIIIPLELVRTQIITRSISYNSRCIPFTQFENYNTTYSTG